MRYAVTGKPVFVSPRSIQYCPELRIPLGQAAGLLCRTSRLAVFAWYVFMAFFLFTYVNTQYTPYLLIYPDFVSGFAALFL